MMRKKDLLLFKTNALKLLSLILLFISSGLIYAQNQKNIVLLDNWTDTTIEKGLGDAVFNDVWGFTYGQNNYCALGSSIGTHIFQVNDDGLSYIDFKAGKYQNRYVEHRDFKIYKNYLYGVCDEGESSLQIFDLSYLPDSAHKVYDSNEFFQICHNIFIDTMNAKLYACGSNNLGMKVLDISNPIDPVLDYEFNELAYVHDCYVRNDTAFLNAGFDGLYVYNFSTPIPSELGILDFYPNQGFNHSGWLSPSGGKYAFIDETQGTKVKICEFDDLSTISISETFGTVDFQDFVPHNIILLDHLAFVSYYNEGLRIFDLTSAPHKEIGVYNTFNRDTDYKLKGAWGVFVIEENNQVLISDRQNGLFLFSFPIDVLNVERKGTYISSMPFLDQNSVLMPRDDLRSDGLTFTIASVNGKIIYEQANYLNYVSLPLEIAAGCYVYVIYDEFGDYLESGSFVKAK